MFCLKRFCTLITKNTALYEFLHLIYSLMYNTGMQFSHNTFKTVKKYTNKHIRNVLRTMLMSLKPAHYRF